MTRSSHQPTTRPLTLQQLVDEPNLGLSVLEPGDLSRPVRGAHAIEIEEPSRWLKQDWVMLTTGLRFVGLPDNAPGQQTLIDELAHAGVSALLFGVGVHFSDVPSGLVAAARQRQFPLLSVSAEVPFFTIEDFVNRAVLSPETHVLKRALRLHHDLLRTLSAEEPVNALIARLGTLSKGTAVLYDISGQTIAATGEGPLRLIWEEINARGDAPQTFSIGRWKVATRPFRIGESRFQIAIASRSESLVDDLGQDVLETTEQILAAATGIRVVTMNQERAEASRLVSALRAGLPNSRVRQTWDRLRPFHFRAGTQMRFIAASLLATQSTVNPRKPLDALLEKAHLERLGLVIHEERDPGELDTPLTAVVAVQRGMDEWLELLATTHFAGVSGAFNDLTAGPHYSREAFTARRLAIRRYESGSGERVIRLDQVDLATWLMARRDDAHVAAKIDQQIGPLRRSNDLAETIVMYLACDQDIKKTAKRLFVHANTVRYRLAKVEDLLGESMASASAITNLYLAFQDAIVAHRSTR